MAGKEVSHSILVLEKRIQVVVLEITNWSIAMTLVLGKFRSHLIMTIVTECLIHQLCIMFVLRSAGNKMWCANLTGKDLCRL